MVVVPCLLTGLGPIRATPLITAADPHILPKGETIDLSGSGLGGATAASMLWPGEEIAAAIQPVDDGALGVVMPQGVQAAREYLLLVEGTGGSTFGIPPDFVDHTTSGLPGAFQPGETRVVVVRSGATLTGEFSANLVFVESGGTYVVVGSGAKVIAAENGAVVDFRGVSSMTSSLLFHSAQTVIEGALPLGVISRQLTPIQASHGIETFAVGHPVNVTTLGNGTVARDPDQAYVHSYSEVTLTATPGPGLAFSGWSGDVVSTGNPLAVQVEDQPLNLTATFSPGWTLDLLEVPGVEIAVSPPGAVQSKGAEVTLTATVEPGYEFLGWGGDLSAAGAVTSFIITANTTVLPIVRPIGYELLPHLTGADRHVLPEGETITFTGSGLGGATAAHLFWLNLESPAAVQPVDDATLEVVMPDLLQETRDHLIRVETPAGATFGIPTAFADHTGDGPPPPFVPGLTKVIVVRAGATLANPPTTDFVHVETGGIFRVPDSGVRVIAAEDGAVIDFRNAAALSATRFYHSPGTLIRGAIPPGVIVIPLGSIRASHGIEPFTVGFPLNVTTVGAGTVARSPDLPYYRSFSDVTLTATPGAGLAFTGWSGDVVSSENPLAVNVGFEAVNLTATFAPGWALDLIEVPGVNVEVSPPGPLYADGTVVTLSAQTDGWHEFLGWGGDLADAGSITSFTITGDTTALPMVRSFDHDLLPQLTGADLHVLPAGGTLTLDGSELGDAVDARLFWEDEEFPAGLLPIDDWSLGVVMPELLQDTRRHLLLVETSGGATFGIPATFLDHTTNGPAGPLPPGQPQVIVVRAGATLAGAATADLVFVEAGGIHRVADGDVRIIAAEDGAVVDFRAADPLAACRLFHGPGTVILGAVPAGVTTRQLPSIRASHGIEPFELGYPLHLAVEGPGSVAVSPQKPYYAVNEAVTLTASPGAGASFIRWIGPLAGSENPGTFTIGGESTQLARFSTTPDSFEAWRLRHFTAGELADPAISGADADPDGDLVANAAEYAFGSNPRAAGPRTPVQARWERLEDRWRFLVSHARPRNAADLTHTLRISSDLLAWTPDPGAPGGIHSEETGIEVLDADTERVTLELSAAGGLPQALFVRIDAMIVE